MTEEILVRALLVVVMAGSGVALIWMARATASGRLGRNQLAGIRLPATMASDEAWLVAHQAARRPTERAGWCALASAVPGVLPVSIPVVTISVMVGCVAMLVFVLRGAALGTRAVKGL